MDEREILIGCSACAAPLVLVYITRPNQEQFTKINCIKCPYCGDHSFSVEIVGGFHVGNTDKCNLADFRYEDDGSVTIEVVEV